MKMESEHFKIVKDSVAGEREIDEQTFASLTILAERLERLKKLDDAFCDIRFSPAVKKLAKQANTLAAC
jgi:hypothetical protein